MRAMACILLGCWASVGIGQSDSPKSDRDAQGAKPRDLIVGSWELANPKGKEQVTMTYTKQGGLTVELKGGPKLEGTYKFLNDETMEVEIKPPAGLDAPPKKHKLKVKLSKDELTTIDEKGKEDKFKRKK